MIEQTQTHHQFDEKTRQNLKYYVYLLIDPFTNQPFYVGKGKDDRVFNHLRCALELETVSDKYNRIREIKNNGKNVDHVIVRHGLTEKEAFEIEASIIDIFDFMKSGITNLAGGHKSIEKGLMTSDEVKRLYNAVDLNEISDGYIIININRNYQRGNGQEEILRSTKETWAIDKSKIDSIKYVLSEYRGLIVEVFKVKSWYEKERGYGIGTKNNGLGLKRIGYGFDLEIASSEIRDKYINKSIQHIKKRGSAQVVRYSI